jgi:hypothetical protein
MLKAYLDGSYSGSGDVAVVAGVVANEDQWFTFPALWQAFLGEHGLKRFHATEYWNRHGQFRSKSDAELLKMRGDIVAMFKQIRPIAVGAIVYAEAYREWRMTARFQPEDPHYYAMGYCLDFLIARLNTYPKDDGVEITCDQDKQRERLSTEMANWHTDRLRQAESRMPGHPEPNRSVSFSFGSSFDIPQIQAADVIAHSALQWGVQDLKTGKADMPFFLDAISPECPIAIQPFWSAEIIRIHEKAYWREIE